MKKRYALIVLMTMCGVALFAQTAADFGLHIMGAGNGVGIASYNGPGGNVVIPGTIGRERVDFVGEYAFEGCDSLTSVTIPEGVTYIGDGAFEGCDNLEAINVSPANRQYKDVDGVLFTKDGKTLVAYPGGGKSVYTIPEGVTYIGDGVFQGCGNLKTISVSPANLEYKDIDGVLFTKDGKTLVAYPGGGKSVYTIPEGVTAIGRRAFSPCANLTSVAIPRSVTAIGNSAFYWCKSLTSVAIPEGVTAIGDFAFASCDRLTSVAVPRSVTAVGNSAFSRCDSLKPEIRADIQKRFGNTAF
ncbi:MAG: leucine-rich repeat domain-containing protein [Treponema sp.]|jgi:hypothetical protein|nr:leucine-rich repeat domain-containing protein [Treponema sp.]